MPRERDLVFEAVCAACHLDYTDLTKSERGRVNRAAKELRDKAPSDILRRGEAAWSRYASMGVTPQTLTKCWTALGEAPGGGDERTTRPGFLTRRRMTA